MINQNYSSANTSINSVKLPAVSKVIKWEMFRDKRVLDYGGGKYNNFKDWLKENYNIDLLIYDPYNRTKEENDHALENPIFDLVLCSNVLNVIKEEEVVDKIIFNITQMADNFVFSIYEGNKSGIGKNSKKDCWQRNEVKTDYLERFYPFKVKIYKGFISNNRFMFKGFHSMNIAKMLSWMQYNDPNGDWNSFLDTKFSEKRICKICLESLQQWDEDCNGDFEPIKGYVGFCKHIIKSK